ncbi:hypothetical protein J2Y40_002665 [Chryseobacterium sp. 2987]|nr:hypothetical protein [Chryseobacterium sp. 2987]
MIKIRIEVGSWKREAIKVINTISVDVFLLFYDLKILFKISKISIILADTAD